MIIKSAETALYFKNIPPGFKRGEKLYIVQYEFSGIQQFIFGDVSLDTSTRDIHNRSMYIRILTDKLEEEVKTRFSKLKVLSKSSGKLIFALSKRTNISELEKLSDCLQRNVFITTDGKLEMYYSYVFSEIQTENNTNVKPDAGGELALGINKNKYHCTNLISAGADDYYRPFEMERLVRNDTSYSEEAVLTSGAGVAAKFDLDNLGAFFHNLTNFDERQRAGDALEDVLDSSFEGVKGTKIIFVGGDDIFAVSNLKYFLQDMGKIYRNIKERINSAWQLNLYRDKFGISAGCSVIRSDLGKVSLMYFFESSEKQLMDAKSNIGKNMISIFGARISWEQLLILGDILAFHEKDIFRGLNNNQEFIIRTSIPELRQRIISINKTKGFLNAREEKTIDGIGR